jgi:hypothetical protein
MNVFPGTGMAVGGNRQAAIRLEHGMRDAADVPQLEKHVAAFFVNSLANSTPAFNLLFRVDARRPRITLALL